MRKLRTLAIVGALALVLAGCSDDDEESSTFVIQTLSDQQADGDIGFNPLLPPDSQYTISQADITKSLLFGIDPDGTEFRAFLDFPLDGSNGGGGVPLGAAIVSADIEVLVNNVDLASTVPTLLDLVPFPITGLTPTDFDSDPIATRTPFNLFRSDIGNFVRIDVTSLMAETQRQGLQDLQLRFLLDAAGLVELDDGDDPSGAPQLTVEYR
jgi:hypothetical protein